jgi:Xaa-Pro dipeptidase
MAQIPTLRAAVQTADIDAWVMLDFRGSNAIAWSALDIPADTHCSRRWAVVIPHDPTKPIEKIAHAIEHHTLDNVEGILSIYATRTEWQQALKNIVERYPRIAIEYSPMNNLPVVSKVDAGTVEILRSFGADISSSADIAQRCSAVLTPKQITDNRTTALHLRRAMHHIMGYIREHLQSNTPITEYMAQQEVLRFFAEHGMVSSSKPDIAVNANAANPHYMPTEAHSSFINQGDVILVDMWAKMLNETDSVYSDITWMAYAGTDIPERPARLFAVLAQARNAVVSYLQDHLGKHDVRGCDLDQVSRSVVEQAGYGSYFFHRTGHSITTQVHGSGANLDTYETHDTRLILPNTSFSIEPGIYIVGDIGLRSEIDIMVYEDYSFSITGGPGQEHIIPLLAENWETYLGKV